MKLILLLLIFSGISAIAQNKGDTKIVVQVNDTTNIFNNALFYFYNNGYTLENKDEALKFIATNEKVIDNNANDLIKLRVLVKENTITFSGEVYMYSRNDKIKVFSPLQDKKNKLSFDYDVWKQVEKIALEFGTIIRYEGHIQKTNIIQGITLGSAAFFYFIILHLPVLII